ncbi:MAG: DNA repair protein RecO [Xylanivirga thermophila]|uniref:DNA repair protein RecO n=1 Tax=Xylanivirga thermophila TaxID=2496273 RepID=UPI0039F5E92D
MRILKTQAIVLRYANFKEADRMLTLLTPGMGRVDAIARGCRKPKSRFLSTSEPFCYGDYVLYKVHNFYIVSQAEVKDIFFDIREDVDKFAYATYILNATEQAINSNEGNYPLFHLLLSTLTYLAYGSTNPEDIMRIFELKFMDILGYRPQVYRCVSCGNDLDKNFKFSIDQGGLLCPRCYNRTSNGYTIQMGTIKTMQYILEMDMKRMDSLKMSTNTRRELKKILSNYVVYYLGKNIKSKDFIDKIGDEC